MYFKPLVPLSRSNAWRRRRLREKRGGRPTPATGQICSQKASSELVSAILMKGPSLDWISLRNSPCLCHEVQHVPCKSRIDADPEDVDSLRNRNWPDLPTTGYSQPSYAGCLRRFPPNSSRVPIFFASRARVRSSRLKGRIFAHADGKSEPRWVGTRRRLGKEQDILQGLQALKAGTRNSLCAAR